MAAQAGASFSLPGQASYLELRIARRESELGGDENHARTAVGGDRLTQTNAMSAPSGIDPVLGY